MYRERGGSKALDKRSELLPPSDSRGLNGKDRSMLTGGYNKLLADKKDSQTASLPDNNGSHSLSIYVYASLCSIYLFK